MTKENLYTKDHIRTFTGKYINVFDPKLETIDILDIAHSLSQQCRFAGHLPRFYSVAQHSVMVMRYMENEELKLQALLHDASESFLMDIPKPIKANMPEYKNIEENLMHKIAEKFGFDWPMHEKVKHADVMLLEFEWETIMIKNDPKTECWDRGYAKNTFLQEFEKLTKKLK